MQRMKRKATLSNSATAILDQLRREANEMIPETNRRNYDLFVTFGEYVPAQGKHGWATNKCPRFHVAEGTWFNLLKFVDYCKGTPIVESFFVVNKTTGTGGSFTNKGIEMIELADGTY